MEGREDGRKEGGRDGGREGGREGFITEGRMKKELNTDAL